MNAAQRLIDSFGTPVPQPLGGTPPRLHRGKDRSFYPIPISPKRMLVFMHSHARRKAGL
jgi:hypothetical protein